MFLSSLASTPCTEQHAGLGLLPVARGSSYPWAVIHDRCEASEPTAVGMSIDPVGDVDFYDGRSIAMGVVPARAAGRNEEVLSDIVYRETTEAFGLDGEATLPRFLPAMPVLVRAPITRDRLTPG
jgi:hypothetical protein